MYVEFQRSAASAKAGHELPHTDGSMMGAVPRVGDHIDAGQHRWKVLQVVWALTVTLRSVTVVVEAIGPRLPGE